MAQAPTTLDLIEPPALDPAWDKAREYLAAGRHAARSLAAEIERLRHRYSRGQGGDRRSKSQSVILKIGDGFQAKLQAELGLHPEQARRIEEAAAYQLRIEQVAKAEVGEQVVWYVKGQSYSTRVTEDMQRLAKEAHESMALPGAPKPSRAWAGIIGEGTRTSRGGKDRGAINHAHNIARGLTALQTSLPHWNELTPQQRAALEEGWELIRNLLPPTWK